MAYKDATLAPGFSGQQINMVPASFISRTAESTIKKGAPVVRGTDEDRGALMGGSGEFLGVSENLSFTGQAVNIFIEGSVLVDVTEDVTNGDPVYFNTTASTWNKTSGTLVSGAVFDSDSMGKVSTVTVGAASGTGVSGFTNPTYSAIHAVAPDGFGAIKFNPSAADYLQDFSGSGDDVSVKFTVDGTEDVTISFDDNYTDLGDLVALLSQELEDVATVVESQGTVTITSKTAGGLQAIIRL